MRFLKVPLDRMVVFHDELDLAPGRVRMKKGGGAGGHNGLRDIDAHVGNDYRRVRIGIGHPGHKDLVLHWVLRDFEPDERDPKTGWVPKVLRALAEESALLVEGGAKADETLHEPGGASRAASRSPGATGHRKSKIMGFNCGIVGLPNVGKSTLFNALTATQAAQAANYPFCTIEPNVGRVAVPDPRLDKLAAIAELGQDHPDPARVRRHRRPGEGRLARAKGWATSSSANIREVDAIAHVLRCFEDGDVTHVEGTVDPVRDAEIVETELMLADLDSLEKRLPNLEKRAKGGDKEAAAEAPVVKKALDALREGRPAREADAHGRGAAGVRQLQLMTAKPMMYVLNVEEAAAATGNAHSAKAEAFAKKRGMLSVVISAAIEAEVAQLPAEDRREYLGLAGPRRRPASPASSAPATSCSIS